MDPGRDPDDVTQREARGRFHTNLLRIPVAYASRGPVCAQTARAIYSFSWLSRAMILIGPTMAPSLFRMLA
jgi:hypothetical protein